MSVEPGFGGQAFIPESLGKIRELRELLDERSLPADIEVDVRRQDRSVQMFRSPDLAKLVSGSGVFKNDIRENTEKFMEILRSYE